MIVGERGGRGGRGRWTNGVGTVNCKKARKYVQVKVQEIQTSKSNKYAIPCIIMVRFALKINCSMITS